MKRTGSLIAILTVLSACTSPDPIGAAADGPVLIASHLGRSYDDAGEKCVRGTAPDGRLSGRDVLKQAWDDITTSPNGTLCSIETTGTCGGRGRWRHVIVARDGSRRVAPLNVDAYTVSSGEVDAWLWYEPGSEGYSGLLGFDQVCGHKGVPVG